MPRIFSRALSAGAAAVMAIVRSLVGAGVSAGLARDWMIVAALIEPSRAANNIRRSSAFMRRLRLNLFRRDCIEIDELRIRQTMSIRRCQYARERAVRIGDDECCLIRLMAHRVTQQIVQMTCSGVDGTGRKIGVDRRDVDGVWHGCRS